MPAETDQSTANKISLQHHKIHISLLASTGDPLRQITSHCCSEDVNITFLRLEAVTAVLLKIPVLWDLMLSLDEWFLMI
jgi:hypothetical protein